MTHLAGTLFFFLHFNTSVNNMGSADRGRRKPESYCINDSGAPARAKRAWDRAPYPWNMVNLFSFGCHVIDRAYVRTRLQIVWVG